MQTRLKPASLNLQYKASPYFAPIIPYLSDSTRSDLPNHLSTHVPTYPSIRLPKDTLPPLLLPQTKKKHTSHHSVQLAYWTTFELRTCRDGAQPHIRPEVKAWSTQGLDILWQDCARNSWPRRLITTQNTHYLPLSLPPLVCQTTLCYVDVVSSNNSVTVV